MDPAYGGPCQGIRNSVPEHDKAGTETDILCFDDPAAEYLKTETLSIFAIGPGKTAWGYTPTLAPWLLEHLTGYDVVIVHGLWQYYNYAVYRAVKKLKRQQRTGIPTVYIMPHGMLDPYFQRTSSRRIKAIRNRIYWDLIEKRVINAANGVLFTCDAELKLARETFPGYAPRQEINVGYGVPEPPEFTAAMESAFRQHCPGLEGPYLLFLSRIHPKKGVDLLVEAYENWLGTNAAERPCLVIAGPDVGSQLGQKLRDTVGENPILEKKVFFTGMLTGLAKWGAFYGCEAFVLPSHQENFGIAVAEALACGKPVLISDKVNIWREIHRKEAGFVSNDSLPGVEDLLHSWSQLDEKDKQKMGERATLSYREDFSIATAARQLLVAASGGRSSTGTVVDSNDKEWTDGPITYR